MGPRFYPALAASSLIANAVLIAVLLSGRSAPPLFGQTANGGGRFILGTEKAGEVPVCFVLDNEKPELLVYRIDPQGQLQLTNAREITCDIKLRDNFFSPQTVQKLPGKTAPPVKAVCDAVSQGGAGAGAATGTPAGGTPKTGTSKNKKEKTEKEKAEKEGPAPEEEQEQGKEEK